MTASKRTGARRAAATCLIVLALAAAGIALSWADVSAWWADHAHRTGWFLLGMLLVVLMGMLLLALLWALMAIWLADRSWPRLIRHALLGAAAALALFLGIPRLGESVPEEVRAPSLLAGLALAMFLAWTAAKLGLDVPLPEDETGDDAAAAQDAAPDWRRVSRRMRELYGIGSANGRPAHPTSGQA